MRIGLIYFLGYLKLFSLDVVCLTKMKRLIKQLHIKLIIFLALFFWLKGDLFAQNNLSPTESVCAGSLRSYRVVGFAGSDIIWTVTGGTIVDGGSDQTSPYTETIAAGSTESIIQVRWGSSAGSYQLVAREETSNSCVSGDLVLTVTVNALPSAPVSGGNTGYCSGNSVSTITATVNSGETVDWFAASTGGTALLSGNTSYTPSSSGTYYAEARNTTSGCVSSSRTAITITEYQVTAGAIGSAQTICSGETPAAFTSTTAATGTGGVSYQWQSSTDNSTFTDIASATSATYTPSSGITQDTWYRREATSTTGSCVATTTSVKVTVNTLPVATYTITDPTVCSGENSQITLSGSESGVSYQLRNNSDDTNVGDAKTGTGSALNFTINVTADIVYNIFATNSNNCSVEMTDLSSVTVADNIAPVLNDLSELSLTDCAADETANPQTRTFTSMSISASKYSDNCNAALTVEYRIELPNGTFANQYGTAASGASSASDPSGYAFPVGESTIYFRVRDNSNNISNIKSYTVTVHYEPNPSQISF